MILTLIIIKPLALMAGYSTYSLIQERYSLVVFGGTEMILLLKNVLDDGLDAALKHAANIPCKFCSFCNLVDWNELASISSLARGTMISIRQSLLNKFKGSL